MQQNHRHYIFSSLSKHGAYITHNSRVWSSIYWSTAFTPVIVVCYVRVVKLTSVLYFNLPHQLLHQHFYFLQFPEFFVKSSKTCVLDFCLQPKTDARAYSDYLRSLKFLLDLHYQCCICREVVAKTLVGTYNPQICCRLHQHLLSQTLISCVFR